MKQSIGNENEVILEISDKISYIQLNKPEKRNALGPDMVAALTQALNVVEGSDAKVLILKGSSKAFCAGADLGNLQKMQSNTFAENLADSQHLRNLFEKLHAFPLPVIACVEGPALAGGCGLAILADFVFASSTAQFGYTETRIGFIPALVSVFLLEKIGEARARPILLSAEIFSAQKAQELGLVYAVFNPDEILEKVQEFARQLITQNSSEAMALIKKLILNLRNTPLDAALDMAAHANAQARETADCKKGIAAFLNKTKPEW